MLRSLLSALIFGSSALVFAVTQDEATPLTLSRDEEMSNDASSGAQCTVRKDVSGWWFVSPQGERFFSLGVCVLDQGSDKADFNAAKPSYAAMRHYETPADWADISLGRLKSWGFTTVGGWSDYETLAQSRRSDFWITPVLHLGSKSGIPWFDMWDDKNVRRIKQVAAARVVPLRDDPRVLGYYSDNELGWWNAILWKMTLEQPPTSGQRKRLLAMVRNIYVNDWNELIQDFEPEDASNWEDLDHGGMLWLRPGSSGIQTIRHFLALAAGRYYQIMHDTIHEFDPGALYLGDRYQSFYYPEVPLASQPYVDVVSTNLNASWNDGTFLRSYLDTLHKLADRPVLVSEFYMAAKENRSGNKNAVGRFPTVVTQDERGKAVSNTLRAVAQLPYVVGADWFQYYDEPPHGRTLDGEDYDFGLVDIHDRPYSALTSAFLSFDPKTIRTAAHSQSPDDTKGIPRAPAEPLADFRFMTALKKWDRVNGFIPPSTRYPTGDLYACWSPSALYFGAYVLDIVEPDYYHDSVIPDVDRATWTIRLNGGAPLELRIGCGKEAIVSDPSIRVKSLSGIYHDVRCITAIELPAGLCEKRTFAPGDEISIESSYTTHGRADRIDWQGTFVLQK
jgi:hypothetical protein